MPNSFGDDGPRMAMDHFLKDLFRYGGTLPTFDPNVPLANVCLTAKPPEPAPPPVPSMREQEKRLVIRVHERYRP